MLVSHLPAFIFVHVQKTAGTSLETFLRAQFPDLVTWHGKHGHARTGFEEMGIEQWRNHFSFAFVRNPWDRLVSWYAMIQYYRDTLPHDLRNSRTPFQSALWNQVVQHGASFDDFLRRCTSVVLDQGCKKSFAFNQIDYLTNADGRMLVEFVGRFERLERDARKVFDRLGLGHHTIPHQNVSEHEHYSRWYSPYTRDLVAERFARDIETFGYTFETED